MRGRQATSGIADAASDRLTRLAQQWRPTPVHDRPQPAWESPGGDSHGGSVPGPSGWQSMPVPITDTSPGAVRLGPWSPAAIRALVVVIALAMVVAGWWWWSGRPRELVVAPSVLATGAPVMGSTEVAGGAPQPASGPSPAAGAAIGPATVVVHVVGQVRHPGIVTLPAGSRVADAVDAAGGVSKKGADDSVNLARVLLDGEQVIVGFGAQAVAGALGIVSPPSTGALLNLNTADAAGFENLPGVGPVLAERIVQWRTTNGPFRSVDELSEVSGIGDAIMGQIRPLVTV